MFFFPFSYSPLLWMGMCTKCICSVVGFCIALAVLFISLSLEIFDNLLEEKNVDTEKLRYSIEY